jgi:hypothetical protein
MFRYLGPLLMVISSVTCAQNVFTEIPISHFINPVSSTAFPKHDRLYILYRYSSAEQGRASALWIDSLGVSHKFADNDFMSKNFIQIVRFGKLNYFYFLERENKYNYLCALIIDEETNAYEICKEKILIEGTPIGGYEKDGKLRFLSFHETTKEFVQRSIEKLTTIETKTFLLPVDNLKDFVVVDPNVPANTTTGRFTTKIFPQENRIIIVIDSKEWDHVSYESTYGILNTLVLSLDCSTETVSQLNFQAKSRGLASSFIEGNTLFRMINSYAHTTLTCFDIDQKKELASHSVFRDSIPKSNRIFRRRWNEISDNYPAHDFFNTLADCDPSIITTPVDSNDVRICLGSYYVINTSAHQHRTYNPNTGNLLADLVCMIVIEPLVDAGTDALSDANVKSKHECRYFYMNYDKQHGTFSPPIQISKTFHEKLDYFDLYQKSKLHLTSLGTTKFRSKGYGIYFNHKHNSLTLLSFY